MLDIENSKIERLDRLARLAVDTWGEAAQYGMVIEEASELLNEVAKIHRNRQNWDNILEEAVDNYIMMTEVFVMYGPEKVNAMLDRKLDKFEANLNKSIERRKIMTEIDLSQICTNRYSVFVGLEKGKLARVQYELTDLEQQNKIILVSVPPHIEELSPSFVEGLFGPYAGQCGGETEFLQKYQFNANPRQMSSIMNGLTRLYAKPIIPSRFERTKSYISNILGRS